jgi:hypothetical protein
VITLVVVIRLKGMGQYGSMLLLSNDEREELTVWSQSRTLPAGDVFERV